MSEMQAEAREALGGIARFWWVWLITGIAWVIIALVVLQFDQASITTVGVLIGILFLVTGLEQFAVAGLVERMRWLPILFGVLFLIAGIVALANPEDTFAGVADVLGFLFLVVGVFWVVRAFAEKGENELWWLGLIAGIAMLVLAFWTSGQFFIEKQYTLLIFVGIWALLQGITDIVRAFGVRRLGKELRRA